MAGDEEKRKIRNIPSQPTHQQDETFSNLEDARRFKGSGDAVTELYDGFNAWSSSLASYGLQAAYALIGANWAVYGSADKILSNEWSKYSLTIIVVYLALNLILTGWMVHLYKRRCIYANYDKYRWGKEFSDPGKIASAWPYTKFIQNLGVVIQYLTILAPTASGVLFVISIFASGSQ